MAGHVQATYQIFENTKIQQGIEILLLDLWLLILFSLLLNIFLLNIIWKKNILCLNSYIF